MYNMFREVFARKSRSAERPTEDHKGAGATAVERGSSQSDPASGEKKQELKVHQAFEKTGFAFPTRKKWKIISIIFIIQCSMNFNAAVYGNAVNGIQKEFDVDHDKTRWGQAAFLIAYGVGCELWAPWSEEFGRFWVMQASLALVNIWQIPCIAAKNFTTIAVGRTLGGLSSAGGSVTLAIVADMWEIDNQQFAVAFVALSSVGGSVLGPVFGGILEEKASWQWVFYTQLIFGIVAQVLHFFLVEETRVTVLLDREAKTRRKEAQAPLNIWGPNEMGNARITFKMCCKIWYRPFEMFALEPIVLFLSLLSGFSDALIFTFLEFYTPLFRQYGFGPIQIGLVFISLLGGYAIAYISFYPTLLSQRRRRLRHPDSVRPEERLWWLLYLTPLLPMGLFGFAWTSMGPSFNVSYGGPIVFSTFIGIANYGIYMATIDYMIASYGPFAASATGGNGFARDVLAGFAALYSRPFYESFHDEKKLVWPSLILFGAAVIVSIPVYLIYFYGPWIRKKSKFAVSLENDGLLQTHAQPAPAPDTQDPEKDESKGSSSPESSSPEQQTQQPSEESTPQPSEQPSQQLTPLAATPRSQSVASFAGRRAMTIRQQSFHGSRTNSAMSSPQSSRPVSRHSGIELSQLGDPQRSASVADLSSERTMSILLQRRLHPRSRPHTAPNSPTNSRPASRHVDLAALATIDSMAVKADGARD